MFLRVDISNLVPAVFSDIVAILTAPAVRNGYLLPYHYTMENNCKYLNHIICNYLIVCKLSVKSKQMLMLMQNNKISLKY
jgi:hypothetical protein